LENAMVGGHAESPKTRGRLPAVNLFCLFKIDIVHKVHKQTIKATVK